MAAGTFITHTPCAHAVICEGNFDFCAFVVVRIFPALVAIICMLEEREMRGFIILMHGYYVPQSAHANYRYTEQPYRVLYHPDHFQLFPLFRTYC